MADDRTPPVSAAMRFQDYTNAWMERRRRRLMPNSAAEYERHLRRFWTLADRPIGEVTLDELQDVVDRLTHDDRLAPRTVRTIVGVVKAALTDAVRNRVIDHDPGSGLRPPRIEKAGRPAALSLDEVRRGEEVALAVQPGGAAWRHWYGPMLVAIIQTGLRGGEARGLQWDDVEVHDAGEVSEGADPLRVCGRIRVREQIPMNAREGGKHRRLKTSTSARTLPISTRLARLLTAHRERVETHGRRSSPRRWKARGYVFPGHTGGPALSDGVRGALQVIAEIAGIEERPTLHSLRHTFASHALDGGLDPYIVAALMGHATPQMTYASYYDPTSAAYEAAVRAFHRD